MDNDVDDDGITNDDDDDDDDADGNDTVDNANHILKATNLEATIDGVDYNLSSNSITIDNNLKITATQTGDSAISVQIDDSYVVPAVEAYAAKYNELVDLVSEELYSDESSIQDKASLQSLLDGVKNTMYEQFGLEDNSLFNSGFSFDQYGVLTIDSAALGKSLMDNPDSMKDLFVGSAEDEGFGTKLKAQLDDLNSYNGLFASYTSSMDTRKTNLEDEKEKTIKDLDTKYDTMAAQFAAYGSMITQMESSFSGLKMIIDQDSAK
jgi:flagellar hook-associated protein 2